MIDKARALALIEPFEGRIPHMYLDTNGHVTVGIGNLLPDSHAAIALMWQWRDNPKGEEPTPEDILGDFTRVSEAVPGHAARTYESITKLDLKDDEIVRLFNRRIDEFVFHLSGHFPGYETFPEAAQLAILDMAFNLGAAALPRKFPRLSQAIRDRNWGQCAIDCHRPQSRDVRNSSTKALFLTAAAEDVDFGALPTSEIT